MWIETIIKGLIIGLVVSIPVGPIAVLCIQRTLNRGRYHGWVTGLGAAASDIFYATLSVLGLSFVIEIIRAHEIIIGIVAAIIIFAFGCYLFRSNPSNNLQASTMGTKEGYIQDFFTAFGLTVSNPLIIFLFITIFAQTNFLHSSTIGVFVGLFSVLIGASLWWFLLTSIVNLFREKINMRGLKLLNKISGGVLMLLAVLGLLFSLTK